MIRLTLANGRHLKVVLIDDLPRLFGGFKADLKLVSSCQIAVKPLFYVVRLQ